jgi:hypothetical protein
MRDDNACKAQLEGFSPEPLPCTLPKRHRGEHVHESDGVRAVWIERKGSVQVLEFSSTT